MGVQALATNCVPNVGHIFMAYIACTVPGIDVFIPFNSHYSAFSVSYHFFLLYLTVDPNGTVSLNTRSSVSKYQSSNSLNIFLQNACSSWLTGRPCLLLFLISMHFSVSS